MEDGTGSSNNTDKWQTVQTEPNKSYQRKVVRIIRDNEGTTLTIYKLTNNHNELEIKKKGERSSSVVRGSRGKITSEIGKYYKGPGSLKTIK